jgi:hypothetical protein
MRIATWAPTLTATLTVVLNLALPAGVWAQSATLDQGSFRISVDGREVGTETFQITRSGAGAEVQVSATGEARLRLPEGETVLRPVLQASGPDLVLSAYRISVTGPAQEEVLVTAGDRRLVSQTRSDRGEREREYRSTPGTVLLDPLLAHPYFLIPSRLTGEVSTIPAVLPREGRQFDLRVTVVAQSVSVPLVEGSATGRHLRLEGGGVVRELWVDSEGRVLRVVDPTRGYVALRLAPPN